MKMTATKFYKFGVNLYDRSGYNIQIDYTLDIRNGVLYVSDRPGLGVELQIEALRAYETTPDDAAN